LIPELIASAPGSGDKEKRFAVEQLHSIISIAKKRQWNKIYEVIMRRLVELCVDLKDHRTAKDGLHQYRNTVVNVRSLTFLLH
jgi:translation initiation factor 3 subunit A